VTVRTPNNGSYRPVGFLTHEDSGEYRFEYLRREVVRTGFRPLPGLARAAQGPMTSNALFPLFAERVISSRRPDREHSMHALGLPMDAAPFEVLVRSHGQRVGDTVELLPAPHVEPGEAVSFTFLAHGVRHLPQPNQERITSLTRGARLLLRPDTGNEHNPRARLVTDVEDIELGWVPDPLVDAMEQIDELVLTVERSNGPDVGFHFRLLVRLQGRLSSERGLFAGPEWTTVGA
jgi:hypothetical protein